MRAPLCYYGNISIMRCLGQVIPRKAGPSHVNFFDEVQFLQELARKHRNMPKSRCSVCVVYCGLCGDKAFFLTHVAYVIRVIIKCFTNNRRLSYFLEWGKHYKLVFLQWAKGETVCQNERVIFVSSLYVVYVDDIYNHTLMVQATIIKHTCLTSTCQILFIKCTIICLPCS